MCVVCVGSVLRGRVEKWGHASIGDFVKQLLQYPTKSWSCQMNGRFGIQLQNADVEGWSGVDIKCDEKICSE